jgi:transcriptional regulator GlxA family with amidase domain
MTRDRTAPATFGIIIYDGVEPIDLGGTIGVVSMSRRVLPAVEAIVIAAEPGPVHLAGGLVALAQFGFTTAPACDRYIVCGGATWPTQAANPDFLAFLRSRAPATLASVCTGAMILAAAGVLDGRLATTRRHRVGAEIASPLDSMATIAPDARPTTALVADDVVITGGGVSLAIDATLYLLGTIYGPDLQHDVAELIEYDRAYAANALALGIAHQATTVR